MNINLSLKLASLTLVLIPALTYGQWTTSGTNIYNTNSGKVGIGTAAPDRTLTVAGNLGVFGISPGIIFTNSESSNKRWDISTNNDMSINETGVLTRMTFKAGGNVGIGTLNPLGKLDVNGAILLPGSNVNSMVRPAVNPTRISGEIAGYSKIALGADDGFLRLSAGGGTNAFTKTFIDLSGYSVVPDMERNITFGTSGIERIRITNSGNVGIGTKDPKGYKLAVAGSMIAESVKVKLIATWPDYVFTKDYQLPSLEETEKHIKENGHLSGIPTAEHVRSNGIELGEMNAKLLQKVEELTLYIINQNQKMKEVVERLENLESKNDKK